MPQPAASVHVCALRYVPTLIKQTGARRLVSAINRELLPETPSAIRRADHLRLAMHDITAAEAAVGVTPPALEHVMELVEFVQSWDQSSPLLIHCYAGLSRSTAAAYISLCALNPWTPEVLIARALRTSSDTAIPNRTFVEAADSVLGRNGRMLAALDSIGPGRIASLGTPFSVAARYGMAALEAVEMRVD